MTVNSLDITSLGQASGRYCASVTVHSVSSSTPFENTRRIPLVIPADELYFWTEDWQASEMRAEADFAAGRSREFDNFMDLARDLLSE